MSLEILSKNMDISKKKKIKIEKIPKDIITIPDSIGKLTNLTSLNISGTEVCDLLDNIGNLFTWRRLLSRKFVFKV